MKFAFSADWHFSGYNQDKKESTTNLAERLFFLVEALKVMIIHCRSEKINTIIVGGDLLHNKSIIHTIALNMLTEIIRFNPDMNFIIIDGNHDLEGKAENVKSGLVGLDAEPNVERIGTEVREYRDEENDILYVPYSTRMVDIIKNNKAKILVSHLGLNEGVLNSGQSIVADVSLADLRGKYEVVLIGHYHTPQDIIEDDIKVYYPGSLIQLNWNDKNEEKRFLVVDTDDMSVESIPTSGYRKYVQLDITKENKEEVYKQAKELKAQGHHIRLRKDEDIDTDDIKDDILIIDRTEKDITNRGITTSMTDMEIIDKFLDIKGIKDKDAYKEVALEIMNSVEE